MLSAVSPASFSGVWGSFGVHAEHQVLPSTFEQRHVSAQLLSRVRLRMGGFYSLWLWTAKGLAIWSPSQSSSFAEEEFEAQMKPFAYYSSILNVPKISLEYLHILVSPSISNSTWFTMVPSAASSFPSSCLARRVLCCSEVCAFCFHHTCLHGFRSLSKNP